MTIPGPADHGYVVLDRRRLGAAYHAPVDAAIAALRREGWSGQPAIDDIEILRGPRSRFRVRQVGRCHFLIGDWRTRGQPLSVLAALHPGPAELARAVVQGGWGRYILVWRHDDGRLVILRDPSGATDCVWWRFKGAVLVAHEPPRALDPLLPMDLAIDWSILAEIATAPELLGDRLALTGLNTANPGAVALISESIETLAVWRPADFCRADVGWDESHDALRAVIDSTVAGLADPHRHLVSEISGGLDSAIAASSLQAGSFAERTRFLNFYGAWREGDERAYARAVADHLGIELATIEKPIEGIRLKQLAPLGQSVRPALQGVDVTYDAEVATRMAQERATGLVTGQGGDAVFFQAPDPKVVVDRYRREGLRGLDPAFLGDVARWTRHSAWTVLGCAIGRGGSASEGLSARRHPWLENIESLPPAKAGQLRQFVNAQLFWGDCLRARAGDLLHPFLSQPVVEHCLRIPSDRLIAGVRDRGLARQAFAGRLPASVIERRSKGDLSCFYGHVTRASLATLTPLLLEGLQVEHGMLDPSRLASDLTGSGLIASASYNRLLVGAVLEVWAQTWKARIAAVRRAHVEIQPV